MDLRRGTRLTPEIGCEFNGWLQHLADGVIRREQEAVESRSSTPGVMSGWDDRGCGWPGNRRLNKVIHAAAISQIRHGAQDRDHYDRKIPQHKSRAEAVRSLKRQLSDVIYYRRMAADARRETVRDGHQGTNPKAA